MRISDKVYNIDECIVFSKTSGPFGGLSNMASGYSLFVNEINIANTEILYQCCRFPLFPKVQREMIAIENPMDAKRIARKYDKYTRQDWNYVRVDVMRWCLKVKLVQNFEAFSELLIKTDNKPIVEYSTRDPFWGAMPFKDGTLRGKNVLGRLLMETREIIKKHKKMESVDPLTIPAFLLFNTPIDIVHSTEYNIEDLDNVYA